MEEVGGFFMVLLVGLVFVTMVIKAILSPLLGLIFGLVVQIWWVFPLGVGGFYAIGWAARTITERIEETAVRRAEGGARASIVSDYVETTASMHRFASGH